MAQYVAFRSGVEVLGQSMHSFFQAAKVHSSVARRILVKNGIPRVLPEEWYSQQRWLDVLREIAASIGEHTLYAIGKKVPESAVWPQAITSIEAGLASIDVAYHLNHRVEGEILFNAETGAMKEGIGHYQCHPDGDRRILMVCHTPYPSVFDRGIITGVARKFKPTVEVIKDEAQPSRAQGADACTFVVKW
jgi:hypothetical protein